MSRTIDLEDLVLKESEVQFRNQILGFTGQPCSVTYTIKQINEIFFLSGGSIPSLLIPGKKKIFERNRLSKIFDILTKVETLTLSATSISIIQCDKK